MQHRHFIIHKPFGFLSQFINNKRRKKRLLQELYNFPEGTMAIGRLDAKSEGLLLLTTDGKLSEAIRAKHVEKEYYVQVDGIITEDAIAALQNGVEINVEGVNYLTLPYPVSLYDRFQFATIATVLQAGSPSPSPKVSSGKFEK